MPLTFLETPLVRKGNSDFAETNQGQKRVRSWSPSKGKWNLTRTGRKYFKKNPSEFVVSLPVRFDVIRARDNAELTFKGYFPVTHLTGAIRDKMEDIMFLKTAFIFPLEDGDDVDAFDAPYLTSTKFWESSSKDNFSTSFISSLYILTESSLLSLISALRASE